MRNPYEVLGVENNASAEEIKNAYLRLSLLYHPDREGGDMGKFQELEQAYAILGDPATRERFDKGLDLPKMTEDQVWAHLIDLIRSEILNDRRHRSSPEYLAQKSLYGDSGTDVIANVRQALEKTIEGHRQNVKQLEANIDKWSKYLEEFRSQNDAGAGTKGFDLMVQMMNGEMDETRRMISVIKSKMEFCESAISLVVTLRFTIYAKKSSVSNDRRFVGSNVFPSFLLGGEL